MHRAVRALLVNSHWPCRVRTSSLAARRKRCDEVRFADENISPHGASGRALINFGDRDFCQLTERSVRRPVMNVGPREDCTHDRITFNIAEAASV